MAVGEVLALCEPAVVLLHLVLEGDAMGRDSRDAVVAGDLAVAPRIRVFDGDGYRVPWAPDRAKHGFWGRVSDRPREHRTTGRRQQGLLAHLAQQHCGLPAGCVPVVGAVMEIQEYQMVKF